MATSFFIAFDKDFTLEMFEELTLPPPSEPIDDVPPPEIDDDGEAQLFVREIEIKRAKSETLLTMNLMTDMSLAPDFGFEEDTFDDVPPPEIDDDGEGQLIVREIEIKRAKSETPLTMNLMTDMSLAPDFGFKEDTFDDVPPPEIDDDGKGQLIVREIEIKRAKSETPLTMNLMTDMSLAPEFGFEEDTFDDVPPPEIDDDGEGQLIVREIEIKRAKSETPLTMNLMTDMSLAPDFGFEEDTFDDVPPPEIDDDGEGQLIVREIEIKRAKSETPLTMNLMTGMSLAPDFGFEEDTFDDVPPPEIDDDGEGKLIVREIEIKRAKSETPLTMNLMTDMSLAPDFGFEEDTFDDVPPPEIDDDGEGQLIVREIEIKRAKSGTPLTMNLMTDMSLAPEFGFEEDTFDDVPPPEIDDDGEGQLIVREIEIKRAKSGTPLTMNLMTDMSLAPDFGFEEDTFDVPPPEIDDNGEAPLIVREIEIKRAKSGTPLTMNLMTDMSLAPDFGFKEDTFDVPSPNTEKADVENASPHEAEDVEDELEEAVVPQIEIEPEETSTNNKIKLMVIVSMVAPFGDDTLIHAGDFKIEVNPTTTIRQIKYEITSRLDICYEDMALIFIGKFLSDARTVEYYLIDDKQSLHLLVESPNKLFKDVFDAFKNLDLSEEKAWFATRNFIHVMHSKYSSGGGNDETPVLTEELLLHELEQLHVPDSDESDNSSADEDEPELDDGTNVVYVGGTGVEYVYDVYTSEEGEESEEHEDEQDAPVEGDVDSENQDDEGDDSDFYPSLAIVQPIFVGFFE